MPSLTTLAPFCAMVLPMWTMFSPWSKQSHGCSCQDCKATNHTGILRNFLNPANTNTRRNSSEPSGTFQTLPLELTPTRARTLRNPPEPSKTCRNQPFGTFRNPPPEPTAAYTGTLRNLPGTCFPNLHHFITELSGTFRNLPPEPTPAYAGTIRNLPEPASGTYTSTHRNSPEPSGTRSGTYTSTLRNSPEPSGTFLRNLLLRPAPAHTGAYLGWRPH